MPKIESKEPTLNGQAFIVKYAEREHLYLRVNRGGKRYTNISLNTSSLAQAHKNALSAYVKIETEPPKSKTRKFNFERVCEQYLGEKELDVRRGQIAPRTQEVYRQRIYQRILPYCKTKGVKSICDITKQSFNDYGSFHLDVTHKGKWKTETSGLSAGTINSDITTLRAILNWMVERELLDPKKVPEIKKVKDRKNYRDEANPAFLPDDWRRFCDELYLMEKGIDDSEALWKRRWFINWVRFQYQSGCRPHESMQIRLGDCEVVNRKDGRIGAIIKISNTTKTGGREVVVNGSTYKRIRYHLNKGIAIRNKQIESRNTQIDCGRNGDLESNVDSVQAPLIKTVSKDDYLFMNPFFDKRNVYHVEHTRQWFNRVLAKCGFERKYTLYSLRSTHISFALLQGQRVDLIAKNCGTSLSMIQKTYDGLSSRYHIDSLGFFKDVQVPREGEDSLISS